MSTTKAPVRDEFTRVASPPPKPAKGPGTGAGADAIERELPEPPRLRKLIGPSVILIGVGIASGEYILYPFIASKAGLVFLWAAVVGIVTQYFINMEIERYTLATGETALAGFQRLWKPWGAILAACAVIATMWPGWATGAATVTTFLVGAGDANVIAIGMLVAIGVTLTVSPVVYHTVETLELLKIGAVLVFVLVALAAAVGGDAYRDAGQIATSVGTFPGSIDLAILVGALAASGAGGANNLVQSNWIRDKGFGMGRYVPRIVSPITGAEEAAPGGRRYTFPQDEENLARWRVWWRRANIEQFVSFVCVGLLAIIVFSLVAYSTLFGNPDLPDESGFDFIALESAVLDARVGSWFGTLFLAIGAVSLFAAALGIVDYVARLVADVVRCGYVRESARWTESRLYFAVVWTLLAFGSTILLLGFDQPLVLLTISTVLGGAIMVLYSCLLIVTNRRMLPTAVKVRGLRLGALAWAIGLLGITTAIVAVDQVRNLL
jgi:hypothetical protein